MSLFVSSLNTGSNGNCFYIGNHHEAILVDAGISCREIEKRMKRLGLLMSKVKAVFISHEHSDHIRGLPVLAKKYQVPVYITAGTLRYSGLSVSDSLVRPFTSYQQVHIGKLAVIPFPKKHDAADPFSFSIVHEDTRVGIFTDIGTPCEHVIQQFRKCHAAFLEANYDDEMLEKGSYPVYLKRRIRSEHGHLSNQQALELFCAHRPDFMSHLFLSHLSRNNNCPDLVHQLFRPHAGDVHVVVASRYEETKVYQISRHAETPATVRQLQLELG
ncbi:MAG TPA: MBL fold metallo-hydrolase [Flavisolibacter sp.]